MSLKNKKLIVCFYIFIIIPISKMFDLKYYATLNEIRTHIDNINDYNKFKGSIKNKDDYLNVYQDFFNKNCIDANTYSTLRLYLILSDMYFSDYDTDVVDKKYAYYKKSIWNGRQNRQLTSAVKS